MKPNSNSNRRTSKKMLRSSAYIQELNDTKIRDQLSRQQSETRSYIQQDEIPKIYIPVSPHALMHIHSRMGKQDQTILDHISAARLSTSITKKARHAVRRMVHPVRLTQTTKPKLEHYSPLYLGPLSYCSA